MRPRLLHAPFSLRVELIEPISPSGRSVVRGAVQQIWG
jgi:hypothetical protein